MRVILDGASLTAIQVVELARCDQPNLSIKPQAREHMTCSWQVAERAASDGPVYGRTTGVGANRITDVAGDLGDTLRLLRSHGTAAGGVVSAEVTRATMIVRLNQLLRGGSGMHPGIADALLAAIQENCIPMVHAHAAIGTGDLSAMAEIGLALMGEHDFHDSERRRLWQPRPGDALPLISSNAATIAAAATALDRAARWYTALTRVVATVFVGLRASRQPLDTSVQAAHPVPGQGIAAADLMALLDEVVDEPARVQDSFGFRVYPQVAGVLVDALESLRNVAEIEMNASAENPFIDVHSEGVLHNGNFHTFALACALDQVKLALTATCQLSMSRVADLSSPAMTGLSSFLSSGAAGSSGGMLLEYVQSAAQAMLRHAAQPATLGSVSISQGTENHASFSSQAVNQLESCLDAADEVLAVEMLMSSRLFTLRGQTPSRRTCVGVFLQDVFDVVDSDCEDRTLTQDLAAVSCLLRSRTESSVS